MALLTNTFKVKDKTRPTDNKKKTKKNKKNNKNKKRPNRKNGLTNQAEPLLIPPT